MAKNVGRCLYDVRILNAMNEIPQPSSASVSDRLGAPLTFRPEPLMVEMLREFGTHERRSVGGAIRELLRYGLQAHGYWPGFEAGSENGEAIREEG